VGPLQTRIVPVVSFVLGVVFGGLGGWRGFDGLAVKLESYVLGVVCLGGVLRRDFIWKLMGL